MDCSRIEFQHEYIDQYHHGYWCALLFKKYKDKLPIPDKILLYGDYYDNEVQGLIKFWDMSYSTQDVEKFQKIQK